MQIPIVEYYSAIKKMKILPFATTWIKFEENTLTEISQTEKDKYCIVSLTCGIQTKNLTQRNGEQNGGCQGQEFGEIGRYW